MVIGHGYFSGEAAFGLRGSIPHARKRCRDRMFPDQNFAVELCVTDIRFAREHKSVFAGGEREEILRLQ